MISSTTIRFTGLASGLDTESMVQAMVMPYKMQVESTQKEQQLLQLKQDAWKELNTKLWNFHTQTLSDLRLESTFNKTQTTVSNGNAIELDSNVTLPEGNHSIQINQVATGAQVSSSNLKGEDGNPLAGDTKLSDLGIVEGTVISVNGTDVTVGADTTLASLGEDMQTALGDEFSAKYDAGIGAFIVNSKNTGANQTITLEAKNADGSPNDALTKLGFKANDDGDFGYSGQDASITYNGGIEVTSSTNNIEVNGLKFTIKEATTQPITISTTKDTDAIFDVVTNFVDEYNALIEEMDKLVSADKNSSYEPLTDEEKASMTDDEIKLWDDKIKESLLSGDPALEDLLSSMRSLLGGVMEGNEFSTLSEIGVSTGSNWKEKGKLYIDEEKLRAAIEKDSDAVINLIAGNSAESLYNEENAVDGKTWADLSTEEKQTWQSENANRTLGIADRLYNHMNELTKSNSLKSTATFYNDKALLNQISDRAERASELESRMYSMEELYYSRFAAMESMLNDLNSQSSWLAGQM